MTKKQKIVIFSVAGLVVALLAAGYFAALPQVQSSNYVSNVKVKQSSVRSEVDKLRGLLEYDLFTKTDQTADDVRVDVKNIQEVLDAIKAKMSTESEPLTKFYEYPLLSWHPAYKNALDLNMYEKTYVNSVDKAVAEMEAVLKYSDDAADIHTKLEAGTAALNTIATLTSIEEIIAVFEEARNSSVEGIEAIEKLTPPESFKEIHIESLTYNKEFLILLDDFIAAMKEADVDKIQTTSDAMDSFIEENEPKLEALLKKIVEESILRKHIDAAAEADGKITEILGKS